MPLMLRDRVRWPAAVFAVLVVGLIVGLGVGATRVLEFGAVLVVAVAGVVSFRVANVRHESRAQAQAVLNAPGVQERVGDAWSGRASLVCAEPPARGADQCSEPARGLLAVCSEQLLFLPGPAAARRGAPERSWRAADLREIKIRRSHLPSGGSEIRSVDVDGRAWFLVVEEAPDLPRVLQAAGLPYRPS
jgi:hypothetical protein